MGFHVLASLFAQGAFWVLLVRGVRELGPGRTALFAALWLAGFLAAGRLGWASLLFSSYVALLDIALVLVIYRGDVRLG